MSEAVRRCCLGWKCDAKFVRGAYIQCIACDNTICLILRREKIVGH